ncbi:TIGR03089 family protein [Jatrophihabitans sp. YIM 134969]
MADTPEALFAAVLRERPDVPLVTWYDETPGRAARVELSARSVANWAAKTAGLLGDELGLGPGDRVFVDPVGHWLLPGLLAGIWVAGAEVVTTADTAVDAAVVVRGGAVTVDADEVFTFDPSSPLQLGAPDDAPGSPPGSRDLPTALRPHPDRLGPARGAASDPALDGATRADLVAAATARAADLGLTAAAGRLLWSGPLSGGDVTTVVVGPWTVAGSLVLVTGDAPLGAERAQALATTEGADVVT